MIPAASPRAFGDTFRLTLLTADPDLADRADAAGVDRIGVDLERLGKADRQRAPHARISHHAVADLAAVAARLRHARAFVRVDPLHPGLADAVEAVIEAGAQAIMLPFFHGPDEIAAFVAMVRGRAEVLILVETAAAVVRIRDVVAVAGVDEVMIGLTDLRLGLGVASHFELLASPLLEMVAHETHRAGLPLSLGGVARPDQAGLPVPADLVLAQYPRLGATGGWLSRAFFRDWPDGLTIADAVAATRRRLTDWSLLSPQMREDARRRMARAAQRSAAELT